MVRQNRVIQRIVKATEHDESLMLDAEIVLGELSGIDATDVHMIVQ